MLLQDFSGKGVTDLIFCRTARLNSKRYLERILPKFREYAEKKRVLYLQQDGNRAHWTKICRKYIEKNFKDLMFPWPGNSPDLNPIENLWSILQWNIDRANPQTKGDLRASI